MIHVDGRPLQALLRDPQIFVDLEQIVGDVRGVDLAGRDARTFDGCDRSVQGFGFRCELCADLCELFLDLRALEVVVVLSQVLAEAHFAGAKFDEFGDVDFFHDIFLSFSGFDPAVWV